MDVRKEYPAKCTSVPISNAPSGKSVMPICASAKFCSMIATKNITVRIRNLHRYIDGTLMGSISKLLRSYVADLLNEGISDSYNIGIEITPDTENAVLECDARLISRAVNNLVQNSMKHNPQGCEICLSIAASENQLVLAVTDNGTGLSAEKLQELENKPHYMESTDERLDLRHGLGLLIVQQVAAAHNGSFKLTNVSPQGCEGVLIFPYIK